MEWLFTFCAILGGLLILMMIGMPIAFAFLLVTSVGVFLLQGGGNAFQQQIISMISSVSSFALVPIPLFILMGTVLWHSNIGKQAIEALDKLLGRLPGRLSLLTMASGSVFSALSGSTMANTALLGKLLLPQMEQRGYSRDLSMGPIMAAGGLAMMIPPSAIAVVLASIAKLSIAKILIAAIIPGLMMAAGYVLYIIIRSMADSKAAPAGSETLSTWSEALSAMARNLLPLGIIIFSVTGLIILGIATPTEAAAMGALSSFLLAALYRRLSVRMMIDSLMDTMRISIMMFAILAGALGFSQILAYSGATTGLLGAVFSWDVQPTLVIVSMMLVVLVLGCFMDQIAIMLITFPFFLPIINSLGYNPIWFAILMLINLETALMTPPLGLLLVIMKGAAPADTSFGDIYKAALPFVVINILVIALLIAFPEMITIPIAALSAR
ncbi:MAG: TRAP transporter large permease subunit [Rhizobiaceae bacterium]|nr:TRAP transporter large permease subunit [Rhizobiaceae bacterium]